MGIYSCGSYRYYALLRFINVSTLPLLYMSHKDSDFFTIQQIDKPRLTAGLVSGLRN